MKRALLWAVAAVFGVVLLALVVGHAVTDTKPADAVDYARTHLPVAITSTMIPTNGVMLHAASAGPQTGTPVILLHGHPEFWWGWHEQIVALARAGMRPVAVDLRGFNASSKPPETEAYRLDTVAHDIVELIHALGYQRAFIVGHDSGAIVGWHLATMTPDIVQGLVVFGVAHPLAFTRGREEPFFAPAVRWARDILFRPGVPRLFLRPFNWLPLTFGLTAFSRSGTFSDAEIDLYRYAWSRDDAITTMFLYPLANPDHYPYPDDARVEVPVLIVVAPDDFTLPPEAARRSRELCRAAAVVELPGVGHWLLHEEPDLTSRLIIDFVRAHD